VRRQGREQVILVCALVSTVKLEISRLNFYHRTDTKYICPYILQYLVFNSPYLPKILLKFDVVDDADSEIVRAQQIEHEPDQTTALVIGHVVKHSVNRLRTVDLIVHRVTIGYGGV
jgi:hypothetical protein